MRNEKAGKVWASMEAKGFSLEPEISYMETEQTLVNMYEDSHNEGSHFKRNYFPFKGNCFRCNKPGHRVINCPIRFPSHRNGEGLGNKGRIRKKGVIGKNEKVMLPNNRKLDGNPRKKLANNTEYMRCAGNYPPRENVRTQAELGVRRKVGRGHGKEDEYPSAHSFASVSLQKRKSEQ